MSQRFTADTGSRFFRVSMTEEDAKQALLVSPLFQAYLQNKIADYASELAVTPLPYSPDPTKQVEAILKVEKFRNYISILEELLSEIFSAQPEQTN
jgi:hypothetical protein